MNRGTMHDVTSIEISDVVAAVDLASTTRWRDIVLRTADGQVFVLTAFFQPGGTQTVRYSAGAQSVEVGGDK